jgi:phosphoglycolate phosphatase
MVHNMKLTKPKMALIDLDGTLVDSAPDIADCMDEMLITLGLPARGEAKARQWIGNGAPRLVKRALVDDMDGEPDGALYEKAYAIFSDLYAKRLCVRSRLYPGVAEGLEALRDLGVKLACVTNKPAQFTEPLLEQLGVSPSFGLVLSGDSLPRKKPDPLPLRHAAEFFAVTPAQSLMVGDSENDVKAARAADFPVVCVDYGYNHGHDIRVAAPDAVIHSLAQLPALFQGG